MTLFKSPEKVKLTRDCPAVQIPSGTPTTLLSGSEVLITQSLGGTYTVLTDEGYMVRVGNQDADALGLQAQARSKIAAESMTHEDVEKAVIEQLKSCYDPEIPVNILELGLVYDRQVQPLPGGGFKVEVKMTLTAPGCGMGGTLSADVKSKVLTIPGVKEADVQLVWDPPWNPSRMSDAAKLDLGFM